MNQILHKTDFAVNPATGFLTVVMVMRCPHSCVGTIRFPVIYLGRFGDNGTYIKEEHPILSNGMHSSPPIRLTSISACGKCFECGTLFGITNVLTDQLKKATDEFVRKTKSAGAEVPQQQGEH